VTLPDPWTIQGDDEALIFCTLNWVLIMLRSLWSIWPNWSHPQAVQPKHAHKTKRFQQSFIKSFEIRIGTLTRTCGLVALGGGEGGDALGGGGGVMAGGGRSTDEADEFLLGSLFTPRNEPLVLPEA